MKIINIAFKSFYVLLLYFLYTFIYNFIFLKLCSDLSLDFELNQLIYSTLNLVILMILILLTFKHKNISINVLQKNTLFNNINILLKYGCIGFFISFLIFFCSIKLPFFHSIMDISIKSDINSFVKNQFIAIIFVFVGVLTEEFYFRYAVYNYFKDELDENSILCIMSIPFALVHSLSIITILNALVIGFILGKIYIKTNSIIYPTIVHLIYNTKELYVLPIVSLFVPLESLNEDIIYVTFLVSGIIFLFLYLVFAIFRNMKLNKNS